MPALAFLLILFVFANVSVHAAAPYLAGTSPLTMDGDLSAAMVAGADRYLLKQIQRAREDRAAQWPGDPAAHRERLKTMIGAIDARLPNHAFELIADTATPALVLETSEARVLRVRWLVFDGVHGEGLLVRPKKKPLARIVYLPDADTNPEQLVDQILLSCGCEIVIPTLISRASTFSVNGRYGVRTNVPHREWIYRQSFELGRHIVGYEVQKVLCLVDWFLAEPKQVPVLVAGIGEGGLIALHAAALDPRIGSAYVGGYFGPREQVWAEPIYRNLFGLLSEFGDAEIASLIAPRRLLIHHTGFPKVNGPPVAQAGERTVAAPGSLASFSFEEVKTEVERARSIAPGDWIKLSLEEETLSQIVAHLLPNEVAHQIVSAAKSDDLGVTIATDESRQKRQVGELQTFTQRLLVDTEAERTQKFWKPLPLTSTDAFASHTAKERGRFWQDAIGRFPHPNVPMNAQSRFLKEIGDVMLYEVKIDVWEDVFVWGWLALPMDLKPGEKRPVVVCQHGLEGLPEDTFIEDPRSKGYQSYKAFALRLARKGYITFAPHNLYRGKDAFRGLQRKLNPLGKSLFTIIIGQHQRILEWLKAQPYVQQDKIAFYGLSYGGKSAMRIPAVLTDYCLSICSADFNEWVRKCVSTDMPMSYLYAHEYEIWEWNLGRTFNYAEMAALIAPRPFMVERGHDDGVGLDEWVDYEYAKVRRLYNKLKIGDQTMIEHFDGPHTINGIGTFRFLDRWLKQ